MRPGMRFLLCSAALVGGAVGLAPDANQSFFQDPDGPAARALSGTPKKKPGSLLMIVRIDARGITVQSATPKPALEYVPTKRRDRARFGWTMKNARGAVIATGGFDSSHVDLDAASVDVRSECACHPATSHRTHAVIKVPALGDFASIEFTRRWLGSTPQPFGSASAATLRVR